MKKNPRPRALDDAELERRKTLLLHSDPSQWWPLRSPFFGVTDNKMEGVFLQHLVNLCKWAWSRKKRVKKSPVTKRMEAAGYFLCTMEFLETRVYPSWSAKEQEKYIRSLRLAGYIQTQRAGTRGFRYISIDFDRVEERVNEVNKARGIFQRSLFPQNGGISFPKSGNLIRGDLKERKKESIPTLPYSPAAGAAGSQSGRGVGFSEPSSRVRKHPPGSYSTNLSITNAATGRTNPAQDSDKEDAPHQPEPRDDTVRAKKSQYKPPYRPRKAHPKLGLAQNQDKPAPASQPRPLDPLRNLKSKPAPVKQRKTIQVSDEAKTIADDLADEYRWPLGSDAQLPEFVQVSMDWHDAFLEKVGTLHDALQAQDPRFPTKKTNSYEWSALRLAAEEVLTWHTDGFARRWAERVHKRVANWKEWSGSLTYLTPGYPAADADLQKYLRKHLESGGCGSDDWDSLISALEVLSK